MFTKATSRNEIQKSENCVYSISCECGRIFTGDNRTTSSVPDHSINWKENKIMRNLQSENSRTLVERGQ
jgi:hypothetical protein